MKFVFLFFICLAFCLPSFSQNFTESAFLLSKNITDTSSNVEMLETCNATFDRLLKGSPGDSLISFYNILSQTKLAYLTFATNPNKALSYINKTNPLLINIDTTFHFGNETKLLNILQSIVKIKITNIENKEDLINFEKNLELFYKNNKQSARANLVYAIYLYNFKKKQNIIQPILETSIVLFDKENILNLPIKWGKSQAENLLKKVRVKK